MQSSSGASKSNGQEFIEISRISLRDVYLPQLIRVVSDLPDEDLWWRPNEASNSVGNLVLHLSGNIRQWIVGSIGDTAVSRDRDREFKERGRISKTDLISLITQTMAEADAVLAGVRDEKLLEVHQIQKFNGTAMHAIYHVVEHFGSHLGQILYIYKLRTGRQPG